MLKYNPSDETGFMTDAFSDHPGAHERQWRRKADNPLFTPDQAQSSNEALSQARQRDQQERNQFLIDLDQALKQAASFDSQVDSEVVLDFKEQLERLYVHAMSLGGELTKQRQALSRLLDIIMGTLERGAADDPVARQRLQDEREARSIYFRLLEQPLVADLMRGEDIIAAEALIPTLLSETGEALDAALELFEPEQLQALATQAEVYLADREQVPAGARERLALIARRAEQAASTTSMN
jgi:hypothetical protein